MPRRRDTRVASQELIDLQRDVKTLESAMTNRAPGLSLLIDTKDLSEKILLMLYTQHPNEHPNLEVERELMRSARVCSSVSAWFQQNARRRDIKEAALSVIGYEPGEEWVLSDEQIQTEDSIVSILERVVQYADRKREWMAPESVWRAIRAAGTGEFYKAERPVIQTLCGGGLSGMSIKDRGRVMEALRER